MTQVLLYLVVGSFVTGIDVLVHNLLARRAVPDGARVGASNLDRLPCSSVAGLAPRNGFHGPMPS